MNTFFRFLYEFLGQFFMGIWLIIEGLYKFSVKADEIVALSKPGNFIEIRINEKAFVPRGPFRQSSEKTKPQHWSYVMRECLEITSQSYKHHTSREHNTTQRSIHI